MVVVVKEVVAAATEAEVVVAMAVVVVAEKVMAVVKKNISKNRYQITYWIKPNCIQPEKQTLFIITHAYTIKQHPHKHIVKNMLKTFVKNNIII